MTTTESPMNLLDEEERSDQFQPETPFLDTRFAAEAWADRETPAALTEREQPWTTEVETPFLTEYHGEAPVNQEVKAIEETLQELFDRDFNEAVSNFAMEATAQAETFARGSGGGDTELQLSEWLDPLQRASEQLFERAGEAVSQQQIETMGETGLEAHLEGFAPAPGTVAPEFEEFFGKIWRKVKSLAGSAVRLGIKGIGALGKLSGLTLGALLKRLTRLVRPLLNRVIRFALGKLPANYRPLATLLGKKLGILNETNALESAEEAAAFPAGETIAQEFDAGVATLLFARDESEATAFLGETAQETRVEGEVNVIGELDAARERFVTQFAQLQNGENAGPVVQQFLPAILPALRIGIRVVGRQQVVNFLARYLARLIQRFVGPTAATPLARALVDVGLRMITLEAEMEPPPRLAARAVATTLEDAMRRVADFGLQHFDKLEESPDQQRLLETIASEAFFESSMSYFPAQLLDVQRLGEREMHLEAPGQQEVWATRPKPRYLKYTKVFQLPLNHRQAAGIFSFGHEPLDAFLRARGVRLPATIKIHLYEAIAGTTLSHISLLEKHVPGLGSGTQAAWSKIHPLTDHAARGLGLPAGLGRQTDPRLLASRHLIAPGQRFYYIEVAGYGKLAEGRASQVNVTIDLRASQVRTNVFFSEADAQRIVSTGPSAGVMTALRFFAGIASGLRQSIVSSFKTGASTHVRFVRETSGGLQGEEFWQALGALAERAAWWIVEKLAEALLEMLKAALIRYLNAQFADFAKAARSPESGVTMIFICPHPGLRVLHAALSGRAPNLSDVRAAAKALQAPLVSIVPGFAWR